MVCYRCFGQDPGQVGHRSGPIARGERQDYVFTASSYSCAHAEVVALSLAQHRLGHYDLGQPDSPACELVSSAEPCLMCLGAVLWSGVRYLVCGARGEDVTALGFDEGPKPQDWVGELRRRGIEVHSDVLRDEAREILRDYQAAGGPIYNARR